jgi:hypothetical protein
VPGPADLGGRCYAPISIRRWRALAAIARRIGT